MSNDEYGFQAPGGGPQPPKERGVHYQPVDDASLTDKQAREAIYSAIKTCQTTYDRWFTSWRQKTLDRNRIEPNAFELKDREDGSTVLICTDGVRSEIARIPDGSRRLFETVLTAPLNTIITILDRWDGRIAKLATTYSTTQKDY
jgi:hypothetical protein